MPKLFFRHTLLNRRAGFTCAFMSLDITAMEPFEVTILAFEFSSDTMNLSVPSHVSFICSFKLTLVTGVSRSPDSNLSCCVIYWFNKLPFIIIFIFSHNEGGHCVTNHGHQIDEECRRGWAAVGGRWRLGSATGR